MKVVTRLGKEVLTGRARLPPLQNASGYLQGCITDMRRDWVDQPGVDRLCFTLRERNLAGRPVAAPPVDPVAWVIKGKGKGKGAPVGKGKGKGLPSEDDTPWTGPWAIQDPLAPPVAAAPEPTRYMSVQVARQQYTAPMSYHLF